MYNFFLPTFTLVGLVAAGCDTGICPGNFPNKTLEETFGDQVKTCCSGHNSYIFTDFCDVSTLTPHFSNSCFIHHTIEYCIEASLCSIAHFNWSFEQGGKIKRCVFISSKKLFFMLIFCEDKRNGRKNSLLLNRFGQS